MIARWLSRQGVDSAHKLGGLGPLTERGPCDGVPARQGRAVSTAVATEPRAVLGELMRAHTPYVWRVLRSLGVRESDLEDVCQETFIIVQRRYHTLENPGALRSWIYGIALRVVSDYRARAHRRHEVLSSEPPQPMFQPPQEDALDRKRAWALIDELMGRMTEEQRQVFVLYEVEELGMREVSEIVGCPLQTAYSRLYAARKHIQDRRLSGRAGRL
jgi:RNA polymerase sigma-70 factor, ECF subfamily